MTGRLLGMPWAGHQGGLYSSPRTLVLKLALGEAPAQGIPATADVRSGVRDPVTRTGVGTVDRVLRHYSDGARVARVHSAAASLHRPGERDLGYDDVEHALGLARTLRIDLAAGASVGQTVAALRQLHPVESVSPQYLAAAPFGALASPAAALDALEAWSSRDLVCASEAMGYEPGDEAVVVGLLDTGAAADSPELWTRLRTGFDTVLLVPADLARGARLIGDGRPADDDASDEVGHGTSCAAIIGGRGEAIPPGMASGCGLLPVRVLGAALLPGRLEPVGIGALSDIDAGLKRAVDLGVKVLNLSFGTPLEALDAADPLPHADVVAYAQARGCILVAASGNSGAEGRYTPAALPGVIAVAAVDDHGRPSAFSTRGEHVALAAPGERVASATLHGYGLVTGTSFAAPFVTAAAALLVSRANRRAYPLDGANVARILRASARPWPAGTAAGFGAGVLDGHAALRLLDEEMDRAPPWDGQPTARYEGAYR